MKHKYKIGDIVELVNFPKEDRLVIKGFQDSRVYKNRKTELTYTFTDGGWDFESSLRLVEPYKEEVMNDKIEVGDTVEITNASYYSSYLSIGDKALVTNVSESGVCQLNFFEKAAKRGSSNLYQASDVNFKDLKLVSKAKQNMKEVIGYKIKDSFLDKQRIILDTVYTTKGTQLNTLVTHQFTPNSAAGNKAKDLGVLDLWFEPVYKSSEVKLTLSGNRSITIKTKDRAVLSGVAEFKASDVVYALDALNGLGQIAGYNVGVKEFTLGCQTFTIDDLQAVDKAFKDFQ